MCLYVIYELLNIVYFRYNMTETTIASPREQYAYLQAHIHKINATVLQQQQSIVSLKESQVVLAQQAQKIQQLQKKIKLVEVYQSQNFNNNQRLFQAQTRVDILEKKVEILETGMLNNVHLQEMEPLSRNDHGQDEMRKLQIRIGQIEEELRKYRHKNSLIAKFRRQISPAAHNNCESTKDMSGEFKQDFKTLEKKLKEYINQQISDQLTKSAQVLPPTLPNHPAEENAFLCLNRKTRVKRNSSHVPIQGQTAFKNRIDSYYNQNTEPPVDCREQTDHKKGGSKKQKRQKHDSRDTKKLKSNSSRSLQKESKRKRATKSSDKLNLTSVSEYMRLRDYNAF